MPSFPTLNILAIGDLGGAATDHVGDEAMFAANVEWIAREVPEARIVALSRDPPATRRRHGVAALRPLGFPTDPTAARARWTSVMAAAEGGSALDPAAAEVLVALDRADVLLVSGGGNLNSTWPEHFYERLALLALAERRGQRVVLLGQTLGPHFEEWDRNELAARLRRVALLGVRESASRELAELWRVPSEVLLDQLDDAFFLGEGVSCDSLELPDEPFLVVTLAGGLRYPAEAARQLSAIATTTKAPLVFIPHAAQPDDDFDLARQLAAQVALQAAAPCRVLPLLEPAAVAAVTGRAALVISGRYHPLVFGLAAGVPCLGIHFDEYTRVKTRGALGRAGLADWSLPAPLAWEGGLSAAAAELWAAREAVRRHLLAGRARWQAARSTHHRRVAAVLRGLAASLGPSSKAVELDSGPQPREAWSRVASAWTAEVERARRERQQLAYFRDVAADYARSLEARLALGGAPRSEA